MSNGLTSSPPQLLVSVVVVVVAVALHVCVAQADWLTSGLVDTPPDTAASRLHTLPRHTRLRCVALPSIRQESDNGLPSRPPPPPPLTGAGG